MQFKRGIKMFKPVLCKETRWCSRSKLRLKPPVTPWKKWSVRNWSLKGLSRERKLSLQESRKCWKELWVLEGKRRQTERLETVKRMNVAKARLQVYEEEVGSDEEISELLHDSEPWQKKSASKQRVSPVHHMAPLHYATNANLLWQCKVYHKSLWNRKPSLSKMIALQHLQKQWQSFF